jgi:hypothetical protein
MRKLGTHNCTHFYDVIHIMFLTKIATVYDFCFVSIHEKTIFNKLNEGIFILLSYPSLALSLKIISIHINTELQTATLECKLYRISKIPEISYLEFIFVTF